MTAEPAFIADAMTEPLCQNVDVVGYRPAPDVKKAILSLIAVEAVIEDAINELHAKGDRSEHGPVVAQNYHAQAYKLEMVLREIYSVSDTLERLPCSRKIS